MTVAPPREQPGRSPQGPAAPAKPLPSGPPAPALQAVGFNGSIHDFNDRLEAVAQAHAAATGTKPTPGVALDIARSPVPKEAFGPLFMATPQTKMQAKAQNALATVNPNQEILDGLKAAIADHKLASYMKDNADQIKSLSSDPAFAKKVAPIISQGIRQGYENGDFETSGVPLAGLSHLLSLGVSQVANSLVHAPGALYGAGKTIVKGDIGVVTNDQKAQQQASDQFGQIVKGSIESVKQDVKHPGDRPGFIVLDLLGLAAPATRVAAGGRALLAGEGLTGAELAATKQAGGTFAIGREGAKENVLLSENPFVAAAQKYRLERQQKQLDLTTVNGEKQPSGLLSITAPNAAKDFLDEHFSFEAKIGREADARRKVEHIVNTTISRELDHVTGGALAQSRVFSRMPSKVRKGLTRGEQKAIQTVSFGVSPDEQIAFHERMIAGEVGDPRAHLRQIADLQLAKKILANPNPRGRFKQALDLTQQVVAEMERTKVDELGLSPVTRVERLAKPGAVVRDQPLHSDVEIPQADLVPGTAGPNFLYHGSPEGVLKEVDPYYGTRQWKEGQGFYVTESPERAAEYARGRTARGERASGAKEKGAINVVKLRPGVRAGALDMDAPADVALWKKMSDQVDKSSDADFKKGVLDHLKPGFTNRDLRDEVLHWHDAWNSETMDSVATFLDKEGYKATTHMEGVKAGHPHRVYIVHSENALDLHSDKAVPLSSLRQAPLKERILNPATAQDFPATGPVEPFYTKLEPRGKKKRPPSDRLGFYQTKPGPFGIPAPTTPPELTHEFTGKAITAGDFRIDATNLTSEAYGRTVRAATVLNEHSRLWKSATDTPKTRFDIPIRDSKKIPDKLRAVLSNIDEGVMTDRESALLPVDMQDLINELYPPLERAQREKIEGVKWIDGRTIGAANEIPSRPGAFVGGVELVQAPIKATTLFLRPAYLLNALGNAGMAVFHQGFAAVPNLAWAIGAKAHIGADAYRTAKALTGSGRAKSYSTAITPRAISTVGGAWNWITDERFRIAALRHEAQELGYTTDAEIRELLLNGGPDLVEATRRANKSMVEFDNLTQFEKNTLRHIIFVYPWVSRSLVWSLRSVVEHPLKTDLLAQLGQQEADSDPIFRHATEWFKRIGYFPVSWAKGIPSVVNPTSINTWSTLGDLISVIGAGLGDVKSAALSDMLGPVAQFFQHATTGKDDYGNAYPDKQWIRAAEDVLLGLPQVTAYKRGGKQNPAVKGIDVAHRESVVAAFNANLKRTVLSPGWLDGYGSLLAGGLSPRGVDLPALEARYWRDATPAQRHANELTLLDSALKIQAELLKAPVPDAVRKGVKVGSDVDFAYKTFQKDNGRAPTAKERAGLLIDHLEAKGLLPDGAASTFRTQLAPLIAESDIARLRTLVFDKYGGGDALRQWDSDVRLVASFDKPVFDQKTRALYKQGLVSSPTPNVSQDALYEYGRKYLTFTRKVTGIQDQIKAGNATTADLRAFEDANDKPVGGLPSFVRTAWSYLPTDQQKQAVASDAVTAWSALSSFEKELLGHKADAKITAGWAKLDDVVAQQKAALARKGESFPAGYKRILAQYVQRYYDAPGLVKDFDFSRKPLYARLESFKPIRQSPNVDKWHEILGAAKTYSAYLKSPDYDKSQVRQMWRDYIANTVEPWVASDKGFADEIASYGKNVLGRLIGG